MNHHEGLLAAVPVGVRPVVHAGVVDDLVGVGALAVGEEDPVQVPPLVLEGVEALEDGGLGDHVLALGGEHRRPHGGGEEDCAGVAATRALHRVHRVVLT